MTFWRQISREWWFDCMIRAISCWFHHYFHLDPTGMVTLMLCWHWESVCCLSCRWSTWWSRWWWAFPRELRGIYGIFMAPLDMHVMTSGKQLSRLGICRCPARTSLQNTTVISSLVSTQYNVIVCFVVLSPSFTNSLDVTVNKFSTFR